MKMLLWLIAAYVAGYPFVVAAIWRNLRNDWGRNYGPERLDAEYARVMHLKTALRAGLVWPGYAAVLLINPLIDLAVGLADVAQALRTWLKRGRS